LIRYIEIVLSELISGVSVKIINVLLLLCLLAFSLFANAQPMSRGDVPSPLSPWVDWVLQDETNIGCPYRYDQNQQTCAWPSRLELALNEKGGQFTQQWQLFSESLIRLPGESEHWPLNVSNQNGVLMVQSKGGLPYVKLPAGEHIISGQFQWQKLPKSLTITPDSGLVDLQVNNKVVERPQFGDGGQLWLLQSDNEKVSEDNIDLQVFRRIFDGHPIKVETLIKLRVSGKQRNTSLNSVLLDGFVAVQLESDLPVRLEGRNQLKVQLRPGEWSIKVVGRAPADLQQFTMPDVVEGWPEQEVWVFVNDNNMRQVQVSGVVSVDPNQTRLPKQWRGLPAYLLSPGKVLSLDVRERGITNLAQNSLSLNRQMWLDFDGGGYSIKDQLGGELQQSRVNVLPGIDLGRVSINQQPQFITRETNNEFAGVEVRQRSLNLAAESRYTGNSSLLPVNGWRLDFQQVDTRVHLPPGWRVVAVTGTDNVPNTWVQKWTLLDLFLVMIVVMSIRHFYGWRWASFALVTLALAWQEGGAPTLIWLNLLAATALLSVLKENRFSKILRNYRWGSLALLAVILLSYMIDTIRVSIYPQLEAGYTQQWGAPEVQYGITGQQQSSRSRDDVSMVKEAVVRKSKLASSKMSVDNYQRNKVDLKTIDPNSLIQSGPGLPSWSAYKYIDLRWSGPVKPEQTSRIVLLSPIVNSIIKLLGIILLLMLAWCFVRNNNEPSDSSSLPAWLRLFKPASLALLLCMTLPMIDSTSSANAQTIPDQQMLDNLKQRLTKPPECAGSCAQIERMAISVSAQRLQARLRVHALTDVSIPLPGSQSTWLPKQVLVNNQPAVALARDGNELLWLSLPKGLHDVVLSGGLFKQISLPLPLPLTPKFVSWASDDQSWTIDGVNENGVANSQLQLTRVIDRDNSQLFQADSSRLSTFVKVERQLQLGLDWYVHTTVTRIAPQIAPLDVVIPLLANEQILDANLTVQEQQVKLNFSANQSSISWSSKLDSASDIVLTAANSADYLEVWSIDVSPVWHIEASGLPISRYLNQEGGQQRVVPVWQPWPREQLTLKVDRPVGVTGQTITIQASQLIVGAGKRTNDVALTLAIRSSRGTQHSIELSPDSDIQLLTIDGIEQRIQRTGNQLDLTLKPGKQEVLINWREPSAQKLYYKFPVVDLGLPSVNAHADIKLSRSRWVLMATGPTLGPAVLFWGTLLALLISSIILGLSKLTPLTTVQWFLLAIGLSQTLPALIIVVVACFIGLSVRERLNFNAKDWQFNLMQVSLMVLIFVSVSIMFGAVANGLLGSPDMQIAGNGSSSNHLKWYQDRVIGGLPQPQIVSVPMWLYRVLMLAWAMWLAMSLLKWIKWGWSALNTDGFWRKKSVIAGTSDSDAT
jgi:hypothetical protein